MAGWGFEVNFGCGIEIEACLFEAQCQRRLAQSITKMISSETDALVRYNCKVPCPWYAYYANSKWVAGEWGGGGRMGGGGQGKESCELRACSPEVSHDTEVSSLVVSTSSLGGRFQSLMVLGKNEVFLTCNAFLL